MKRRVVIIWMAVVVLAVIYAYLVRPLVWQGFVVEKVFRDQQTLDAFLQAREATAERLHLDRNKGSGELASYFRVHPVKLSPEQVKEVQRLLRKGSSYDWRPVEKECIVDYGVLLTFHSREQPIRIALCFDCNWLGVFKGTDDHSLNINSEMDFDPIRRELSALARSLFPHDLEIQNLK